MPLLARYTPNNGLDLCDIETQAVVFHIPQQRDTRRSQKWIAEHFADQEGHEIAEWDYSNLTTSTL
jgi:hypothetical protein